MSDLLDLVVDTFPANNDVGVPLQSNITITLSGLNYNSDSLKDGMFVEGPDTDQYIGPDLELQTFPENVSQGDLDDFLQSPGYQGIVKGVVTVSGIAGNTVVTFDPEKPLFPNIQYIVNLTGVLTGTLASIDGFVSFGFETGTGSIEVIPSSISTSVLSAGIPEASLPASAEDLKVVSTLPADRAIQQLTSLSEIVVTFNKNINPVSVDVDDIIVRTIPASDHPNASKQSLGDLAKAVEVVGNQLKIKI
jgi:hypothetical protein